MLSLILWWMGMEDYIKLEEIRSSDELGKITSR